MLRAYYALTHIASQLIYRWLPPPLDTPELAREDPPQAVVEPEDLSQDEVLDLLAWENGRAGGRRLAWLPRYLEAQDPGGRALAAAVVAYFARMRDLGGQWICPVDRAYPPLLATVPDPPLGLGVIGALDLLERPLISVVGSRQASAFAIRESYDVGRQLAAAGVTVVSGGALGCDIAAHHGVLAAGLSPAPAVCIFAGGLAELYPRTNAFVFRRLRERRALLVSERLWEAPCFARDFHVRNRLIAGMSGLTVVMQAAAASGAMLTARLAADQGRDLAILSHPRGDVRAEGSLTLIEDGAAAFADAAGLLANLQPDVAAAPSRGQNPENLLRS